MSGGSDHYAVASVIGETGSLQAWHCSDGNARRVQSGCNVSGPSCVTSLFDGARIVSCAQAKSGSTTVVTFDLSRSSGGPSARCGGPETTLSALTSSHDDGLLAAGGKSGRIYLWHYSSGRLFASFDAHIGAVTRLAFSSDNSLLVSAGADASVHVWPVRVLADIARDRALALRPSLTLRAHALPVHTLSLGRGPASARVVTGSVDRSLRLWHMGSAQEIGHVSLPCAPVDSALNLMETECFVALQNGDVLVVALNNLPQNATVSYSAFPKLRPPPTAERKSCPAVSALALSPTAQELVVGYSDGVVRIFDTTSRILLRVYSRHNVTHPVSAVVVLHPIPPALQDASLASCALVSVDGQREKAAVNQNPSEIRASHVAKLAASVPPPVLAKIERLDEPFTPTVCVQGGTDIVAESWSHIDGPEWAANISTHAERAVDDQKAATGQGGSALLLAEIERLRKRNRELEAAGAQLCDIVAIIGR